MIYLVSPYTDPDPAVREARFRAACAAAAALLQAGRLVFAPVVHGHPLVAHGVPTDWSFWAIYARRMIAACDEVVVLTLDGWRDSVGVEAEIALAAELGKSVRYLTPGGDGSPTLAAFATSTRR